MLVRKCEKIRRISLFATRRMWSGSQIHLRDRTTLWNNIISNSTNSSCLIPRHYSNNTKYTTCTSTMRTTPKGKYKIYAIAEQGNSTYGAREYHLLPLQLFTASSSSSSLLLNRRDINEFRVASLYATKNVFLLNWGTWLQGRSIVVNLKSECKP